MIGIYLSGTGNTKHCIEKLLHLLDETAQAIPIEKKEVVELLSQHDFIVLAYPVQFSNAPVMIRDFIKQHSNIWKGKQVLCVATMALFSGDGAGCSARLLKKYGAKVVGGLHIHMPDSICDVKLLKKSIKKNQEIVKAADKKIEKWAEKIKYGKYPKDGLYFYDRIAGFICQRFWYYGKTKDYSDKLKFNHNCTGCGLCVRLCPMKSWELDISEYICNIVEKLKIQVNKGEIMKTTKWIFCPVCSNKTRTMIREDTEMKNFPLYCPKYRQENLIDAKDLQVTVVKRFEANKQD